MKNILRTLAVVSFIVLGSAAVFAQSPQSANIAISANVVPQCQIQAGSLDFGDYDPIAANATTDLLATGSFDVRCTRLTNSLIGMDEGLQPAAGSTAAAPLRQMANGAERLRYDLYRTAPNTGVWGNTAATQRAFVLANSAFQTLTIYGTIPQAQDVAQGPYGDTVIASVNF